MIQAPLQLRPHNPDVLACIANLSNDEIFTPPDLVNQMLDTLETCWANANSGASIWEDKNVTFLDPCTKSGVFLREVVRRLTVGLANEFPDLNERVNHILSNQVYGIAITELTGLLARRSLYCSKYANSIHSVARAFENGEGNVWFEKTEHTWAANGHCQSCGANAAEYSRSTDLETHAYAFIHGESVHSQISRIFGGEMQFDVIIGNPPYQLNDGGYRASARAIYHLFVTQAKRLNPRFVSFVIPSRWFSGGKGLDDFRREMLSDTRIRVLHDFLNSSEIFPGTDIKGGVCYFLWDRDNPGLPVVTTHDSGQIIASSERPLLEPGIDVFIRHETGLSILRKVTALETDSGVREDHLVPLDHKSFSTIVSSRKPFGFPTDFRGQPAPKGLATVPIHQIGGVGFVQDSDISAGRHLMSGWKVLVGYAGSGDQYPSPVISRPFLARPGSTCTETYLVIGPFKTKSEAENVLAYMSTRFARFMILLRKASQHITKAVYEFLPLQDFSIEWTDDGLYKRYELSEEEISFIEKMVKPMELHHG